jgi:mannopine transport system permease protein
MVPKTKNLANNSSQIAVKIAFYLFGLIVVAFVVSPLLVLIPCSFNQSQMLEWPHKALSLKWYASILGSKNWGLAFFTSLALASTVATISTIVGSAVASFYFERRQMGKQFIRLFFLSPLVIPIISLALAMYICLVRIRLTDTFLGLVGTHCILCIPFVFAITSASFKKRGTPLEEAAQNLGASKLQTWLYVTIPSIKEAILAAFLLCFATSFNEVVVTIFMTDINVQTISKRMWDGIRFEISPVLAVASILTILIAVPAVMALDFFVNKSFWRLPDGGR